MDEHDPDLTVGTTPVVQEAKQHGRPALYFTNLISARPLMGPAGAGSLAQVVNGAIEGRERMATMEAFFEGVGVGHATGVWEDTPVENTSFAKKFAAKAKIAANAVDAGEAVGT